MNRNSLGDQIRDIVEGAVNSMDFSQLNHQIKNTVNGALDEVRKAVGPYQSPESKQNQYNNNQGWNNPNQQQGWNNSNQGAGYNPNNKTHASNHQQTGYQQANHRQQGYQQAGYQQPRYGEQARNQQQGYQQAHYNQQPGNQHHQQGYQQSRYQQSPRYENTRPGQTRYQESRPQKVNQKPKGSKNVSGILLTVFGGIGTGLFGIGALVTYMIASFSGIFVVLGPVSSVLSVLFLGFAFMLSKGISIRQRLKRYRDYVRVLRGNTFCSIDEMAGMVGKSKRYVISDLRRMIRIGLFPEGHIDQKKTSFITTDETFKQYLASVKSYEERRKQDEIKEKEKKWVRKGKKAVVDEEFMNEEFMNDKNNGSNKNNGNNKNTGNKTEDAKEQSELYRTIKTGRAYIIQIRQANDDIPGEEISRKLDRLEEITTKIFICVENHPEQLSEIRRFMEYYLPTTLKLVNAYKEFDSQIVQGENITSAKAEIENTLDTINDAFERLLDSLFQDAAMEVSADISVLNTLLAQEGLTKRDFK